MAKKKTPAKVAKTTQQAAPKQAKSKAGSARARRYWLMKSEPTSFSFDDLMAAPKRRTAWDGVRNFQARNYMRDEMEVGDLVLFYYSSSDPAGVAGIARIAGAAEPDPTQFDPNSDHFDGKSKAEAPSWVQIEIQGIRKLPTFVTLGELRAEPGLSKMLLLQRGQRLSIQPVTAAEWALVLGLGGLDPDEF
jgi:predicted RNA-binding protein with PUA-like domain